MVFITNHSQINKRVLSTTSFVTILCQINKSDYSRHITELCVVCYLTLLCCVFPCVFTGDGKPCVKFVFRAFFPVILLPTGRSSRANQTDSSRFIVTTLFIRTQNNLFLTNTECLFTHVTGAVISNFICKKHPTKPILWGFVSHPIYELRSSNHFHWIKRHQIDYCRRLLFADSPTFSEAVEISYQGKAWKTTGFHSTLGGQVATDQVGVQVYYNYLFALNCDLDLLLGSQGFCFTAKNRIPPTSRVTNREVDE